MDKLQDKYNFAVIPIVMRMQILVRSHFSTNK